MKKILTAGTLLATFCAYEYYEKQAVEVTDYIYSHTKLNQNMKIAVVADLHEAKFGKGYHKLLRLLDHQFPDLICIPGDFVTAQRGRDLAKYGYPKESLAFLRDLSGIAPVCYSPGNHESRLAEGEGIRRQLFEQVMEVCDKNGILYLANESEILEICGNRIEVTGLEIHFGYYSKETRVKMQPAYLDRILPKKKDPKALQLLMAHNPAFFESYAQKDFDLVLSGHNHGGLVRLPHVGAVVSPQFELFPRYDAGRFDTGNSTLLISRGLGTHTIPIRVNNRAELLTVDMRSRQDR